MHNEKRRGDARITDNLEELLNEAQRKALPGLQYIGWEPCFLRMKMFLEPDIVMRNCNDNRLGILEYDGRIKTEEDVRVREEDEQTKATLPDKPPVWKK
jgi:hypothetical protein